MSKDEHGNNLYSLGETPERFRDLRQEFERLARVLPRTAVDEQRLRLRQRHHDAYHRALQKQYERLKEAASGADPLEALARHAQGIASIPAQSADTVLGVTQAWADSMHVKRLKAALVQYQIVQRTDLAHVCWRGDYDLKRARQGYLLEKLDEVGDTSSL